jgi:GT2 family glycosyltransferase
MTALAIVPTYLRDPSDASQAAKTLQGLERTFPDRVVVVDDGSPNPDLRDEFRQFAEGLGTTTFIEKENTGFADTINVGLRMAREDERDAVLVNADIEFIRKDWFQKMTETEADVIGARLLFPNGLIQHAGIYFSLIARRPEHIYRLAPGSLNLARKERVCPVTGALQLIRYETLKNVGLYDDNFRMGYEDFDYCIRVFQSGRKCIYQPDAVAIHHEGLFRRREGRAAQWFDESWLYFGQKWEGKDFTANVPTLIGEDKWG